MVTLCESAFTPDFASCRDWLRKHKCVAHVSRSGQAMVPGEILGRRIKDQLRYSVNPFDVGHETA
mgnify:CR=1 FL=1